MPRASRPSRRPTKLVRQIVKAAHDLTKHKHPPYWVSVYDVARAMGSEVTAEIREGIHSAMLQNLLRADSTEN
jgi:hypothetical protein